MLGTKARVVLGKEREFQKQQERPASEAGILLESFLVFLRGLLLNKKVCKQTGLLLQQVPLNAQHFLITKPLCARPPPIAQLQFSFKFKFPFQKINAPDYFQLAFLPVLAKLSICVRLFYFFF